MEEADNNTDSGIRGYSQFNQNVCMFDFGNIIVRKDFKDTNQVALVSGGTTSHVEFVGKGMLTASIQGIKGSSPTPAEILKTFRELSVYQLRGIIVITQANPTDVLNFGLAVERGTNDDLGLQFLKVNDDSHNKRNGLAGVVLVNKIAGALANINKTSNDIVNYCSKVIENLISIGQNIHLKLLSHRECIYCKKCSMVIDGTTRKTILKKITIMDVLHDTVEEMLSELLSDRITFDPGDKVVVLVNNLRVLGQNEQFAFYRHIVKYLTNKDLVLSRFYIGPYLYLPNEADLTLTILKITQPSILEFLDAPCETTGWKSSFQTNSLTLTDNIMPASLKRKCRLSPPLKGPQLGESDSNLVLLCLTFACDALASCEKMLNKMDSESGDGDTGTKLRMVSDVLKKRACNNKLVCSYPFTFLLSLSKLLENTMGGTLGCIYSLMFEAAANVFGEYPLDSEVTSNMWVKAVENSCDSLHKYGNVELGDRTMYDALKTFATFFRQYHEDRSPIYAFEEGVRMAEEAAKSTKTCGRRFPDPGAQAVGIWLRAVCEAVKLKRLE